jgi:hypothetical protein
MAAVSLKFGDKNKEALAGEGIQNFSLRKISEA